MSRAMCVGMSVTRSSGTSLRTTGLMDWTPDRSVVSVTGIAAQRGAGHGLIASSWPTRPVLE